MNDDSSDDADFVFDPSRYWSSATIAEQNLAVAMRLADHWLHVHPCNSNKAPIIQWGKEADKIGRGSSHDSIVIKNWFGHGRDAIPGINAGKNNLLVIDCDRKPNKPDGVAAFWEIAARHGGIPDACPIVSTPSNGRHVYFRQPDGAPLGNGTGALPNGIDVRGVGGQVIAPGACLSDGREWQHVAGSPDLAEAFAAGTIPLLPEWLAEMLRAPKAGELRAEEQPLTANSTPAGDRERAWAGATLEGVAADLAAAGEGGRNSALNAAAYRLGRIVARGWLSESEVRAALEEASRANGLWRDGPREVRATITSGLCGGLANPHEDLAERDDSDPSVARLAAEIGRTLVEDEDGTLHDPETDEIVEPVNGREAANRDNLTVAAWLRLEL